MEKEQEDMIKKLMLPLKYIMPAIVMFILYLMIFNPLLEREKKQLLREIARSYDGVLLDLYLSPKKYPYAKILLADSTILKEPVSLIMAGVIELGDSIHKLEGLNECMIFSRRTGKRFLVSYKDLYKGMTDSIMFFSNKKDIIKKYPNIEIIEMTDGQAREQIKERKIRVNYKMD